MNVDWNALGHLKTEELAQTAINLICDMELSFPMPAENWKQFVKDVEHTNKKRGWNLIINERQE